MIFYGRKSITIVFYSFMVLIFFIFISLSIQSVKGEGKTPVADARCGFSASDVTQKYVYTTTGVTIYFDGSKSFDRNTGGSVREYYWDFGDGYTDIGERREHSYSSVGNFTVKLLVTNKDGEGSPIPSNVYVSINNGLKAKIKLPREDKKGFMKKDDENENKVKFAGVASGGTPCYEKQHYKYKWSSDKVGIIGNEKEFSLKTSLLPFGWHEITLEVSDCLNNTAKDSIKVAIVKPLEAKILKLCKETKTGGNPITIGKVVFDSSWTSFLSYGPKSKGFESCDNGNYIKNLAKWLEPKEKENKRILIYTNGGKNSKTQSLRNFLEGEGYTVNVHEGTQDITENLLKNYGQVWFLDTNDNSPISEAEIDAIVNYHKKGGNILLSGEAKDGEDYASNSLMINGIAEKFGVRMKKALKVSSHDSNYCVSPTFKTHEVTKNVEKISTSGSDVLIEITDNPKVKVIAKVEGNTPYIAVLDSEKINAGTKTYLCDCEVKLTGQASGGMPPYEVKWISQNDGVFDRFWINSSGGTYKITTTPPMLPPLTEGTHTFTFEVTDDLGLKATDTRYEVEVKNCCAIDTNCKTYWPKHEGPMVNTGNENVHTCDSFEVCHPDLQPLFKEAIECCRWGCKGNCHGSCEIGYKYGEELGTTPEGLTQEGLKRCVGLYLLYGFGPEAEYMSDYFFPETCCAGYAPVCYLPTVGCCSGDLGKCRCLGHVYTKNALSLPCKGLVSSSPAGWKSDAAMNKNTCMFSDLSAHMSILGDQGIKTEAEGINTGTCCDYSTALTTALRIAGYKPNEIYSVTGPGHCYNLILFPEEKKYHIIDSTGNNFIGTPIEYKPWIKHGNPLGPVYCSYFNCRNDNGMFGCPRNTYGC